MQSSLHCITQTTLRASKAKSFAMKPTLADQVKKFMGARDGREALTPTQMAELVAKHQSDLPEKNRCGRQNIEQLLEQGFQTPRYIAALAAAMGTDVETLRSGRYSVDAPKVHRIDQSKTVTIESSFDTFTKPLAVFDADTRKHILAAVELYCRNPSADSPHRRYVIDALSGELPGAESLPRVSNG